MGIGGRWKMGRVFGMSSFGYPPLHVPRMLTRELVLYILKNCAEKKLKAASTPSCFKVTQTGQFVSGQFLWEVSYVPRQLKRASGCRYWRSTEESSEKEARWCVVAGTEEESKKRSKKRQRNILEVPASHKREPGAVRRRAPPPGRGPAARPGRPLRGPTRAPAGDRPSVSEAVQYVGGWLSGGW